VATKRKADANAFGSQSSVERLRRPKDADTVLPDHERDRKRPRAIADLPAFALRTALA